MITVFTAKVPQRKVHRLNQPTDSNANAKTGGLSIHDINTAEELSALFQSLNPKQSIISGVFPYDTLTEQNRREKSRADTNNPWYKMDGDYNINCQRLTIDILQKADPQLAQARYLDLNSSSNITMPDNTIKNPHKVGIWMQFSSTSQEDIQTYADTLFKRLVILGYGQFILSSSKRSYQTYLRTVIDKAVFSPERISFEASPECHDGITHNKRYHSVEGNAIDPKALPPLNAMEEAQYHTTVKALREDIEAEVQNRRSHVKENHPADYDRQEQIQEGNYILTSLIANDNTEITNPAFKGKAKHKAFSSPMRDPLDPDYGTSKAEAYLNEDGSMWLHSFAHGSTTHRLLFEARRALDEGVFTKWSEKTKITRKDKGEVRRKLEEIAPRMLYTQTDLQLFAEELPLSKPVIQALLSEKAVSKEHIEAQQRVNDLGGVYKMLESGSAPMISLDTQTGIQSLSATGFSRVIDDDYAVAIMTEQAERVNGFGMYYNTPHKKLNLWGGFTVAELNKTVTEEDIAPFLYLLKLNTDHEWHKSNPSKEWADTIASEHPVETEGTKYLLDWFADIIQNPLRSEDLRTSIHVKGINRTGKSVLSFLIGSFFAPYNRKMVSNWEEVFTRFNSFLSHTVFIQAEEAKFAHGLYEQFKSLTSSAYNDVELKGVNGTTQVPNCVRVYQTSNTDAKREDLADTRTTVFTILAKHREDKKWFEAFHKWWATGGEEAVFTYLLRRKYDMHFITTALQNADTIEGKVRSLDNAQRYGLSMLGADKTKLGSATSLYGGFEQQYPNDKFYSASNKLTKVLRDLFTAYDGEEGFYKHNNDWHIDVPKCKEVIAGRLSCKWSELEPVLIKNDILDKEA